MLKELDRDGLTDPSKWFILEMYMYLKMIMSHVISC
jgi:hypothetical protein